MLSDKWTEIEFALQMLGISEEEAKGIWAILAAICHLGCAGVAVGKCIIQLRLEPTDPLEMLPLLNIIIYVSCVSPQNVLCTC